MKQFLLFVSVFLLSNNSYSDTMSGPRLGITYLSPNMVDFAASKGAYVEPVITQFGWQFEKKFLTTTSGPEGVTALIPLVGGIEQSEFIPSLTWLIGLRLRNGYEFGVGPNVSVGTSGMSFTMGHSNKFGELYVPKNIGLTISNEGVRLSFLFGFNSKFESKPK